MSVHARIRQLAQTPEGRAKLNRWSGCDTSGWQPAFEQAGDFATRRLFALHDASPPLPPEIAFGSLEWRRANQERGDQVHAVVLAELEQA